jgi:hypothetical protein
LAGCFAAGLHPSSVAEVVLVEVEDAKISQQSFVRLALSALTPAVQFKVATAKRIP